MNTKSVVINFNDQSATGVWVEGESHAPDLTNESYQPKWRMCSVTRRRICDEKGTERSGKITKANPGLRSSLIFRGKKSRWRQNKEKRGEGEGEREREREIVTPRFRSRPH